MNLINELSALSAQWRIQAQGHRNLATNEGILTARQVERHANALDRILIDAERGNETPLLDQLAAIREALELAPRAGHATVMSRIGHIRAEAADHAEHSDFHSARYQRLRLQLTGILGVDDDSFDGMILDMIRERADNAWLLTPDAELGLATATEAGSFRQGRHSPRNIWLDPDRDDDTGTQVIVMFAESQSAELVRSLNLFPAAGYTSGPAARADRAIMLNGVAVGFGMAVEWAQAAVDAMNAHYQSSRIAKGLRPADDQSGDTNG